MGIFINPGTGPVEGATPENAVANVEQFIADLDIGDVTFKAAGEDDDGLFPFRLYKGYEKCEIEMPGLPVELVRYMEREDQNIFDFPRMYVEGSSWIWSIAVRVVRRTLMGEEEDEE